MKLIDRYIVRQFILTSLFGLVAFLLIFVVIDMMEKLDDFIDAGVGIHIVAEYYLTFVPEIIRLMTPVALLLAALFVTGRLSNYNELAAMKSSGISLYRLLAPFLGVALVISLCSIYFNGWVVPYANQRKFDIERRYLQKSISATGRFDIYFQVGRTKLVSIGYYDGNSRVASRVSIQEFSDTNNTVLIRRYDAAQMKWVQPQDGEGSTERSGWVLVRGTVRDFSEGKRVFTPFAELPIGGLGITFEEIEKKQRKPDEMAYGELAEFIKSQQAAGQDVSRWLVDYHSKIAFPFASFIVVLFGVPFSSNRRRSGVAIEIGISVAVTFIYLAFFKISQVFGYNGDLDPLLTAWLANLFFLSAAFVNIARVQK